MSEGCDSNAGDSNAREALTFYRFVAVKDVTAVQIALQEQGTQLGLRGTILLANEGVNGTLVGTDAGLQAMQQTLVAQFGEMSFKWSAIDSDNAGFYRFKVKIKPEIVTFGVPGLDAELTGEHVSFQEWNRLMQDPDVVLIDTRNQYEIDIGTFPGAVSPESTNFREFPEWVAESLDPARNKKVAMFCTGGIRCEKASAYLLQQGFDSVFQLDGGILNYLKTVPSEENLWHGECFVFDQRVSVDADLKQGSYKQCFACRHPLSAADMASTCYEKGVSCPHCIEQQDESKQQRFRHRQYQVELARKRGQMHIGSAQTKPAKSG